MKSLRIIIATLTLLLGTGWAAQAASFVLATATRTALAADSAGGGGLNQLLDTGVLKIYSGSYDTGTVLVSLTLPAKASNSAVNGVLTFGAITQQNASETGTAAYFKLFKSDGTTEVAHGDVSTSGATLNLNTTAIVTGGPVSITSFTITVPAGS
jgi:hypothetical protein